MDQRVMRVGRLSDHDEEELVGQATDGRVRESPGSGFGGPGFLKGFIKL